MASLTGSTIASSYEQLLSLPDGGLNGNTLVAITDGDSSTAIGMKVATSKIEIIPASDDANAFEVSKADGTAVLTVNTSTVGATLIGALTVGVDDAGHDVIFYGNTASSNMTWDTSEDDLILNDATLSVVQDDNAIGISVDNNGTSYGLQIENTGSTGYGLYVYSDMNANTTLPLVDIHADNAAFDESVLRVVADGSGSGVQILNRTTAAYGLEIDQDVNKPAIYIDSESTSEAIFRIDTPVLTTGNALQINNADALTDGSIAYFQSDSDDTNSRSLVQIINDNVSATGTTCLKIVQDSVGADAPCIELHQTGQTTDSQWINFHDIDALAWQFRKSGDTDDSDADANLQICDGATTQTMLFHQGDACVTMSTQPAFQARPTSQQSNIATGSAVGVVFGTEVFDQGGDFASNTFTAPVTGRYMLSVNLYLSSVDSAADYYSLTLTTSNRHYEFIIDPDFGQDAVYLTLTHSALADMDASDTAIVTLTQNTGTAQTDIGTASYFSGYLAC